LPQRFEAILIGICESQRVEASVKFTFGNAEVGHIVILVPEGDIKFTFDTRVGY